MAYRTALHVDDWKLGCVSKNLVHIFRSAYQLVSILVSFKGANQLSWWRVGEWKTQWWTAPGDSLPVQYLQYSSILYRFNICHIAIFTNFISLQYLQYCSIYIQSIWYIEQIEQVQCMIVYFVSSQVQARSRLIMRMKRVATIKTTPKIGGSDFKLNRLRLICTSREYVKSKWS